VARFRPHCKVSIDENGDFVCQPDAVGVLKAIERLHRTERKQLGALLSEADGCLPGFRVVKVGDYRGVNVANLSGDEARLLELLRPVGTEHQADDLIRKIYHKKANHRLRGRLRQLEHRIRDRARKHDSEFEVWRPRAGIVQLRRRERINDRLNC
jgi:hypothetical protein